MTQPIRLSVRLFSKIFWEIMFSQSDELISEKNTLLNRLKPLEDLRLNAKYNTGSITFGSAWCIYLAAKYFKVKKVIEIGTFIGKSTISIASAMDEHAIDGVVHTCDFSNDIKLPWNGKTKIYQYPMASSNQMLQKLSGTYDFCFFISTVIIFSVTSLY
jgi:hypothetical protein